jgi:hypothetical protein
MTTGNSKNRTRKKGGKKWKKNGKQIRFGRGE